ncbi:nuclear transport factor 2 family protein [Cupriavidus gilardii]|uniref:nuclear transport factor 2 family protein n=1 Tax=Cupriavidus gilardii TaxID=82541 RepID=UPI001ABE2AA4|nr:nuclear transport factor 2 family protein [Cupriavidus gilardii]MBO4120426.1 nuclear transport factor 2 family protein [Cupriavidus gilardii]
MDIPTVVSAYFEADKSDDADALVSLFLPDAVVNDESARHQGSEAIRAWWLAAKEKYRHVAEPIEATGNDPEVRVRARVSGQFPNSPVTLEFLFTIDNDKIAELKIH